MVGSPLQVSILLLEVAKAARSRKPHRHMPSQTDVNSRAGLPRTAPRLSFTSPSFRFASTSQLRLTKRTTTVHKENSRWHMLNANGRAANVVINGSNGSKALRLILSHSGLIENNAHPLQPSLVKMPPPPPISMLKTNTASQANGNERFFHSGTRPPTTLSTLTWGARG